MSQSAVSREHSTGHPAVAHAPASVYAQDGLLNGIPAAHHTALNALQQAAQRQSEVGQSAHAALSDVSLGFPQLRAHTVPAANVLPQAPMLAANGLQAHIADARAPQPAVPTPHAAQPQAATVTTGASLSEGKTVAGSMHPRGALHGGEAATSSQAPAGAQQQAALAQLQAALHQQLHCQPDGRQSGGGSALSGHDTRYVENLTQEKTCFVVVGFFYVMLLTNGDRFAHNRSTSSWACFMHQHVSLSALSAHSMQAAHP